MTVAYQLLLEHFARIWTENSPGTAARGQHEDNRQYRGRTRGAFRTWQKAVYGHANVVTALLKHGLRTGDGGADTPATAAAALGNAMRVQAETAAEEREENVARTEQATQYRDALRTRRALRFGRLTEDELTTTQAEDLQRLKSGELTAPRAREQGDIATKLARSLGAESVPAPT